MFTVEFLDNEKKYGDKIDVVQTQASTFDELKEIIVCFVMAKKIFKVYDKDSYLILSSFDDDSKPVKNCKIVKLQ